MTETTYKYVGPGAGNLAFTSSKIFLCGRITITISGILLLILVIILWPRPGVSTTTPFCPNANTQCVEDACSRQCSIIGGNADSCATCRQAAVPRCCIEPDNIARMGECIFWGDPHIRTFDGGRPSFYGDGEYWIVKSSQVYIQGRFRGTAYTEGLSATNKIIIGGPFLQGHTIAVGTIESGEFLIDGAPACSNFPSRCGIPGLASITYSSQGDLPDEAGTSQGQSGPRRIAHIRLPLKVTVEVYRWNNYLDLRITLPSSIQPDGCCGNFNGNPADDSSMAIMERQAARVRKGENMFGHRVEVGWTATEEKLLSMCAADKRQRAEQYCHGVFGGEGTVRQHKSCYLDYCWGDNHHALREAKRMGI